MGNENTTVVNSGYQNSYIIVILPFIYLLLCILSSYNQLRILLYITLYQQDDLLAQELKYPCRNKVHFGAQK